MRVDVVTLFPELVNSLGVCGVTGRAVERGQVQIATWNPRDYTDDTHRTVDDRPYGGGPGMLMMIEPLQRAIEAAQQAEAGPNKVALLSPQGRRFDQAAAQELATRDERTIFVAARYEGVDERLAKRLVDEEWSIGDYVLSGGELAAMVMIDATARLLPGVLGHADSAEQDSFMDGLLDCPHYTRPEVYEGQAVPEVLLSGNHAAIARWRHQQALGRTALRRPDLLRDRALSADDQALLDEFLREHAAAGSED